MIAKERFVGHSSRTFIRKINGSGVENPSATYRVEPGAVRLMVENRYETLGGRGEIAVQAKAGHRYVVKSDQAVGMKVKFWIEDQSSNREVAALFVPLEISDDKRPKPPLYVPIFVPVR